MLKIIMITIVMLLWVCTLPAQEAASTTASASTAINLSVGTSKTSELNFGKFTTNDKAGEIILTPYNERSTKGGIKIIARNENVGAASFIINNSNSAYSLVMPVECMIVRKDGSETMNICYFDYKVVKQPEEGKEFISIGATLKVHANQKAGLYTPTSSFDIVYNYN